MTLFSSTSTRRAAATVAAGMTLAGATVAFSAPAQAAPMSAWDAIAECESGGNWSLNDGSHSAIDGQYFYGGLQFTLTSWRAVGGQGYPHQASKAEQIQRAEMLQDLQGWGAWPVCSARAGLSGKDTAPDAVVSAAPVERTSTVTAVEETPAPKAAAVEETPAPKAAAVEAEAEETPAPKAVVKAAPKAAAVETEAEETPAPKAAVVEDEAEVETITVKAGDSLWKLAKKYDVDGGWKALYAANEDVIDDPSLIFVGQELVLPQA